MKRALRFRKAKPSEDIVEWLYKELDKAYLAQGHAEEVKQKKTFSPSSIGYGHGKCARYWYLAFEGKSVFAQANNARAISIMMNGTYTHERIQKVMDEAGLLKDQEVEIELESPPIRGYLDGLLNVPGEEDIPVLEIKSAMSMSWEARRTNNAPMPYHLIQLLIYLKATGAQRGVFMYENKDTQEPLFIVVEMTDENDKIIQEVFAWLREVRKSYDDGVLPGRPIKRTDATLCKQCPIAKACWSRQNDPSYVIPIMEMPK